MCPLRPTAIATPGATASSIDVLTILLSLPRSAVSSPELLRPSSGSMYLTGVGEAAAILAAGGGGAQAATAAIDMTVMTEAFIYELRTRGGIFDVASRGKDDLLVMKQRPKPMSVSSLQ